MTTNDNNDANEQGLGFSKMDDKMDKDTQATDNKASAEDNKGTAGSTDAAPLSGKYNHNS